MELPASKKHMGPQMACPCKPLSLIATRNDRSGSCMGTGVKKIPHTLACIPTALPVLTRGSHSLPPYHYLLRSTLVKLKHDPLVQFHRGSETMLGMVGV
jgi:hypothetical protein